MRKLCVLAIAGLDPTGGAGLAADLKTFAALDVHGLCVVTAVTVQSTRGVHAIHELSPEFVSKQLETVMQDFEIEWAKTGMLSNAGIIRAVEAKAKQYELKMVVDPIMVSTTGAPLLREDAFKDLKRLIGYAKLVTPNIFEAEKLSGFKIRSKAEIRRAARIISELGPEAVLIKGGHLDREEIVDTLYVGGRFREFKIRRITTESLHGIGCSFVSAITAELAKGADIEKAIINAEKFIGDAIESKLDIGKGIGLVNQMAMSARSAELGRALDEVWRAAKYLVENPDFAKLLPEVGSNIVMALPDAKKIQDVVGLSGRMVKVGSKAFLTGFPELGGSEHVANSVLTAMRYDPRIRAGMNIRFSDEILSICEMLGLSIGEFDRSEEPKNVKTMEWGIKRAIEKVGRVPQVIFDRGGKGKEAMIRLLGNSPEEIAGLASLIARKLTNVGES